VQIGCGHLSNRIFAKQGDAYAPIDVAASLPWFGSLRELQRL
jgi:hypothetical protein